MTKTFVESLQITDRNATASFKVFHFHTLKLEKQLRKLENRSQGKKLKTLYEGGGRIIAKAKHTDQPKYQKPIESKSTNHPRHRQLCFNIEIIKFRFRNSHLKTHEKPKTQEKKVREAKNVRRYLSTGTGGKIGILEPE